MQHEKKPHAFEMHSVKYHMYPADQIGTEAIYVALRLHGSCQSDFQGIFGRQVKQNVLKGSVVLF